MKTKIRIVICWSDISGYMASCWREFSSRPNIELHVIAFLPQKAKSNSNFSASTMKEIPCTLLNEIDRENKILIQKKVQNFAPDCVVIPGWMHKPFTSLALGPLANNTKFIMAMDNPWIGKPKQYLAKFALHKLLRNIDGVFVPGERAWQYAKRLGIDENKIFRGVYGVDADKLQNCYTERTNHEKEWPKQFLFTGRYIKIKGIDTLLEAYKIYRNHSNNPWGLTCCGMGPLSGLVDNTEGVTNAGFIQPSDLHEYFSTHGAAIMASTYDPWPLSIVEACASGLPIICTESCGSSVENVRPYHNGIIVPTNNPQAMAKAMLWIDNNHTNLHEMGKRSINFGQAYSPKHWADRWESAIQSI